MERGKPGLSRLDWLALSCFLLWCAGAALTHGIGIWAGMGGTAIGLGVAALFLARSTLTPLLQPSRSILAWGVAAAVVMVAATYGLYPVLRHESAALARGVHGLYAFFSGAGPLWITRVLLPFMILAEELVWRGVVQEALGRRLSPASAVLVAGVAYAAAHAPVGSPLLVALALACGLFWSLLRAWTHNLIPGFLSHLAWDFLVFVFYPLT